MNHHRNPLTVHKDSHSTPEEPHTRSQLARKSRRSDGEVPMPNIKRTQPWEDDREFIVFEFKRTRPRVLAWAALMLFIALSAFFLDFRTGSFAYRAALTSNVILSGALFIFVNGSWLYAKWMESRGLSQLDTDKEAKGTLPSPLRDATTTQHFRALRARAKHDVEESASAAASVASPLPPSTTLVDPTARKPHTTSPLWLRNLASISEAACALYFTLLIIVASWDYHFQQSSCLWLDNIRNSADNEQCSTRLYQVWYFAVQGPVLVGQPRTFQVVGGYILGGITMISLVRFHDTSTASGVLLHVAAISYLAFLATLKYKLELLRRRRFAAVIALGLQRDATAKDSATLRRLLLNITPKHLHRYIGSGTIDDGGSSRRNHGPGQHFSPSNAICAVMEVRNLLPFLQTFLPQQAASRYGLIHHHIAKAGADHSFTHIRQCGDTHYFVADSFFEGNTTDQTQKNLLSTDEENASLRQTLTKGIAFAASVCRTSAEKVQLAAGLSCGMLVGLPMGRSFIRYDVYGPALQEARELAAEAPAGKVSISSTIEAILTSTEPNSATASYALSTSQISSSSTISTSSNVRRPSGGAAFSTSNGETISNASSTEHSQQGHNGSVFFRPGAVSPSREEGSGSTTDDASFQPLPQNSQTACFVDGLPSAPSVVHERGVKQSSSSLEHSTQHQHHHHQQQLSGLGSPQEGDASSSTTSSIIHQLLLEEEEQDGAATVGGGGNTSPSSSASDDENADDFVDESLSAPVEEEVPSLPVSLRNAGHHDDEDTTDDARATAADNTTIFVGEASTSEENAPPPLWDTQSAGCCGLIIRFANPIVEAKAVTQFRQDHRQSFILINGFLAGFTSLLAVITVAEWRQAAGIEVPERSFHDASTDAATAKAVSVVLLLLIAALSHGLAAVHISMNVRAVPTAAHFTVTAVAAAALSVGLNFGRPLYFLPVSDNVGFLVWIYGFCWVYTGAPLRLTLVFQLLLAVMYILFLVLYEPMRMRMDTIPAMMVFPMMLVAALHHKVEREYYAASLETVAKSSEISELRRARGALLNTLLPPCVFAATPSIIEDVTACARKPFGNIDRVDAWHQSDCVVGTFDVSIVSANQNSGGVDATGLSSSMISTIELLERLVHDTSATHGTLSIISIVGGRITIAAVNKPNKKMKDVTNQKKLPSSEQKDRSGDDSLLATLDPISSTQLGETASAPSVSLPSESEVHIMDSATTDATVLATCDMMFVIHRLLQHQEHIMAATSTTSSLLRVSGGISFETAQHILRVSVYPSHDLMGVAVNQSRSIAKAVPVAMIAMTERLAELYVREVPPEQKVPLQFGAGQSWRLRDVGSVRVVRAELMGSQKER